MAATSSGLPGRILSRLWRLASLPLALILDDFFDFGLFGRRKRMPRGFWSRVSTRSHATPRQAPEPTPPPPPPVDDGGYFTGGAG